MVKKKKKYAKKKRTRVYASEPSSSMTIVEKRRRGIITTGGSESRTVTRSSSGTRAGVKVDSSTADHDRIGSPQRQLRDHRQGVGEVQERQYQRQRRREWIVFAGRWIGPAAIRRTRRTGPGPVRPDGTARRATDFRVRRNEDRDGRTSACRAY